MPYLTPHPLETFLRNRWIVNHIDGPMDDRFRHLIAEAGYPNKILDVRQLIQAEIDKNYERTDRCRSIDPASTAYQV